MDVDKVLFLDVSGASLRQEVLDLVVALEGDSIYLSPLPLGMDALAINFSSLESKKAFLKKLLPLLNLRGLDFSPMRGSRGRGDLYIWEEV